MRVIAILTSLAVSATAFLSPAPARAEEPLPVSHNFLASVLLALPQTDADAPGTNDWTCRPTSAHPNPVVLVHGTWGNKNTNWRTYGPLLHNNGYCAFAFTYGAHPGPGLDQIGGQRAIETGARDLAAFVSAVLDATGADKVDLIGHSQGTLMPNYYAKFLGGAEHIDRYVSLASLWHGTRLSGAFRALAGLFGLSEAELPVCAACAQMAVGSDFLAAMRTGPVAVPGIRYTNIVSRYDEIVAPFSSGIETGMRNIVLQNVCALDLSDHAEIVASPVAAAIVLNTLDPAHPRPIPCQLVLPLTGPIGG